MTRFVEGNISWRRRGVRLGYNLGSMVAKICNAYHCNKISTSKFRKETHLPRLNEIDDVRVLVYVTIVHHNYRVRGRKQLHLIQGTFDKFVEGCSVESTFNDVTMEDTLFKG